MNFPKLAELERQKYDIVKERDRFVHEIMECGGPELSDFAEREIEKAIERLKAEDAKRKFEKRIDQLEEEIADLNSDIEDEKYEMKKIQEDTVNHQLKMERDRLERELGREVREHQREKEAMERDFEQRIFMSRMMISEKFYMFNDISTKLVSNHNLVPVKLIFLRLIKQYKPN